MPNVAGKAYAMNVVTPINRKALKFINTTWLKILIFRVTRSFPSNLGGLLGLSIIHFARWAIIKRDQWPDLGQGKQKLQYDYMLFCSNFNGTWDQYIDAFSDGIPNGLDLLWYGSTKYPNSIPMGPFKSYIVHNQFDTNYYYNATPGSAQRDIKRSLRVLSAIRKLADDCDSMDPAAFAAAYRTQLVEVQNCLGSPGIAPVASRSTETADKNRQDYVRNLSNDTAGDD